MTVINLVPRGIGVVFVILYVDNFISEYDANEVFRQEKFTKQTNASSVSELLDVVAARKVHFVFNRICVLFVDFFFNFFTCFIVVLVKYGSNIW